MKIKNDKYKRARGRTRILKLHCEECGKFLFFYQKDGPGPLKRLYLDRIFGETKDSCDCGNILGSYMIYKKENRPAIRLFVDSIRKEKYVRTTAS